MSPYLWHLFYEKIIKGLARKGNKKKSDLGATLENITAVQLPLPTSTTAHTQQILTEAFCHVTDCSADLVLLPIENS